MKKHTVIILAGGEKGPLYEPTGYEIKALIPIHGKPMIDWVVESFAKCPLVENIVVAGSEELDSCASMVHVRKRIFTGVNLFQNLLHAVTYVKTILYNNAHDHNGYIISFCDAVFLTPEIITDTLTNINDTNADFLLHYIEKSSFEKAGIPAKRTYIPIGNGHYTGSTIYYLKKFSSLKNFLPILLQMRKNRKDPRGLLNAIGCEGTSFEEVEETLSKQLDALLRIKVSPHPFLGMDVDKPADLELAKELLPNPWKHAYKKIAVIYNPAAGAGKPLPRLLQLLFSIDQRRTGEKHTTEQAHSHIQSELKRYGMDALWQQTNKKGEAAEYARQLAEEGCDLIIAAGGDGTVNEVINGIAEHPETTLGVIPLGAVNLFAMAQKIPDTIEGACGLIASGNTTTVDLGKIDNRYFAVMAGVGFDAFVLECADRKKRAVAGTLGYVLTAISHLFRYTFRPIRVTLDEQPIVRQGYFVVINNSPYYGGKMKLASDADTQDGLLDVSIYKHRNVFALLHYLLALRSGKSETVTSREYFQCRMMHLHKTGNHPIHVDAEQFGRTPATISVCPQKLRIAAGLQTGK